MACKYVLCLLMSICSSSDAFVNKFNARIPNSSSSYTPRLGHYIRLAPLSDFDCTYLASNQSYRTCIDENGMLHVDEDKGEPYVLGIAEEDDLPDISRLTIDAFGDIAISLSSDLTNLERALLSPGVALWNGYSGYIAYSEVLSGLRTRMKDKLHKVDLSAPPVKDNVSEEESEAIAARSSLILALARPKAESDERNGRIDAIATVELRLQPTDAKIPFSQPWLDSIERRAAKALGVNLPLRDEKLQPYLSNLCVSENARGRRIGKSLVRCVEMIASDTWGYEKIYLHVDLQNAAALNLYKSEGYEDVGFRWNVPWAGGASDIGYFVKKLKAS